MELNNLESEQNMAVQLYLKHKDYILSLYPIQDTLKLKNRKYQDSLKKDPETYALVQAKRREYYMTNKQRIKEKKQKNI